MTLLFETWNGVSTILESAHIRVPSGTSQKVFDLDLAAIADPQAGIFVAEAGVGESGWCFHGMPFEMDMPPATLEVETLSQDTETLICRVRAQTYARVVTLRGQAIADDNYFDLRAGESKIIRLELPKNREVPSLHFEVWNGSSVQVPMIIHLSQSTLRAKVDGQSRQLRLRVVEGFSLVELMASMAILAFLMVIIAGVTNEASVTVRSASALIDASQSGRSGFDIITQKLSQATLNTYLDYDSPTAPTKYVRKSDLQFLVTQNASGTGQNIHFQAPTAYSQTQSYEDTKGLLNAFGFFVQYGNDDAFRPGIITNQRWRYRLMEGMQPTENLTIFSDPTNGWTTAVDAAAWPIADNIIALIVWPRLPVSEDSAGTFVTTNYLYDSRNAGSSSVQFAQIAPVIQVTLVMIDEAAAVRLDTHSRIPPTVISSALAASPFNDVTEYQADLAALQTALTAAHINYQVLNTTVSVRESEWSSTPL